VLKPGSRAGLRSNSGHLEDIEIVKPFLFNPADFGLEGDAGLWYEYRPWAAKEDQTRRKASENRIETVGDEWSWILWDSETESFRDEREE
jgi:hypothetical protein